MPSRENMNQESASAEFEDDSYVSRPGQKNEDLNVVSDKDQIEDPIDEATADSEEQLAQDDNDAIDESNIIDERTRGAKPDGTYREPGDDEGIPSEDGRSVM